MVLREGLPVIRAEWVWFLLKKGALKAVPLLETRVLVVVSPCRFRKTYCREMGGKLVKRAVRYWLGRGIFLAPRWFPLEQVYDPVADQGIEVFGLEKLKERGMYRLSDGQIVVLCYQHVDDLLHLQRQQWHIQEEYDRELERLGAVVATIENKALIWLEANRRKAIVQILQRRRPIEDACAVYLAVVSRKLKDWKDQVLAVFSSQDAKKFAEKGETSQGLRARLETICSELDSLVVRPVRRFLNLSRRRLQEAIAALEANNPTGFKRGIELAAKHLQRAQEALRQPQEVELPPKHWAKRPKQSWVINDNPAFILLIDYC